MARVLVYTIAIIWVIEAPAQSTPPTATARMAHRYRHDRILVLPNPVREMTSLAALHARHRCAVARTFSQLGNLQVVMLPPGLSVEQAVAKYQQSGLVLFAEPDYAARALVAPNDPKYRDGTLWGLHNTGQSGGIENADIDAPEGWDILTLAQDVIVAVIDSGVNYNHEDLAINMWRNPGEIPDNKKDDDRNGYADDVYGIDAVNNSGDPTDVHGHGTHAAGIIGAVGNNNLGVVGVAWRVQIMACRFLDSQGNGFVSDAVQCIDYARSKGAKIINASWGDTENSLALRSAIIRARDAGMIFVAAVGNESRDLDAKPIYPSSYPLDNIVAVAAITRTGALADYSNFGATSVDLAAPGSSIYSLWHDSNSAYTYASGTSMAAPFVSGVFALMRSRYPNDTYKQLIDRVLAGAKPLPSLAGKCLTGGRISLQNAIGPSLLADFVANPAIGPVPLKVQFTNQSLGIVVSQVWDFGDGSPTSIEPNPIHVYANEGRFHVTLSVSGTNGLVSSKSRIISAVANYTISTTNFSWIDPSKMQAITLADNGVSSARVLPFTFVFYGQSYDRIYVGANGILGFINQGLETTSNVNMPNASLPNAIICPYWDDLNPARKGSVHAGTIGQPNARRFVVSWVSVPRSSTTATELTFQAVLEEDSQNLVFQYLEVQPSHTRGAGRRATIGLEDETGAVAAKYAFDGAPALLTNNMALLFSSTSTGAITVSPTDDFFADGPLGGPFNPSGFVYMIKNTGKKQIKWAATNSQDWLELSVTQGLLLPGQTAYVVLAVNSKARLLDVGSYRDTVAFLNTDTGLGNTTRQVHLAVNGTNGVLTVSPDHGLTASGPVGGPFSPPNKVYTLINTGDAILDWSAIKDQDWLSLSRSSGKLAAGESATATVTINNLAADLPPGAHTGAILFTNLTSGLGAHVRAVTVNIASVQKTQLSPVYPVADGQFILRLTGPPGANYRIDASVDLLDWIPVFTNTVPVEGSFDFDDVAAGSFNQRFYRAAELGPQ